MKIILLVQAGNTIQMIANLGLACHIKSNGSVTRKLEVCDKSPTINSIRFFAKEELFAEDYESEAELLIPDGEAMMADRKLNIGDEWNLSKGVYAVRNIIKSRSRRGEKHGNSKLRPKSI